MVRRVSCALVWLTATLSGVSACACSGGSVTSPASQKCAGPQCEGADGGAGTSSTASAAYCIASPAASDSSAGCSAGDAFDDALGRITFDRCSLGLSSDAVAMSKLDANDPRQLPDFKALHQSPLALARRGDALAHQLDAAMDSDTPVANAIVVASAQRGDPISACVDPAWLAVDAAEAAPLAKELSLAASKVSAVPVDLQRALVPIVRAIRDADHEIVLARAPATSDQVRWASKVPSWLLGVRHFYLSNDLFSVWDRIDVKRIETAAARVALVIERASLGRFAGRALQPISLPTPFGAIVLSGATNDAHGAETADAAFVLDTGGDDSYKSPVGTSGTSRAVSVLVDLGGSDRYFDQVGAGLVGVGMAFDLGAGNDSYATTDATQGVGSHGVGVLFDDGGNDAYAAGGVAQGAAAWGVGLLLDASGDDKYAIDTAGEGYGFTRGVGMLVDAKGNDRYVANPGDPSLGGTVKYPSDQLPGKPQSLVAGNFSFAQGCGAGHRPDWPDSGFPLPGGMGVLRDASGNDSYKASVFGQGCAFVQGVGMLLDGAGNDAYDALYYAQGAAAHMGAALFRDEAGDDRYNDVFPIVNASLGAAHDLSVAVHWDGGGDDHVEAPNFSLGAGYANGVGVYVNNGGTDDFLVANKLSRGFALFGSDTPAARKNVPTVGVFVRAGGATKYKVSGKDVSTPGGTWLQDTKDDGVDRGIGVDRPAGTASVR